MFVSKSTS